MTLHLAARHPRPPEPVGGPTAPVPPHPAITRPPSGARPWRVAIITESFAPSVNGVARSVGHVLSQLQRYGCEVLVVAPGPSHPDDGRVPVIRMPSIPLPLCRGFPLGVPTPLLRAALARFVPDVVHLASPIALGARGATVARDLGIPIVAIYQTDVAGFAEQYGLDRSARPLWRWLRRIHNTADRTLAPSTSAVATLRRHGVLRVHGWPRGVDTHAFHPRHRRRPATTDVTPVRVGYVGRLSAEKRVDRLAVLRDLPGIELTVIGDGAQRAALQARLPWARFTGQLSGRELSQAYADLDIFVHTGTHETFCQAVQEALASGVPVVAPAAGGPLDLVVPGRNGLLWDPRDVGSLRTAVTTLAADGPFRATLGRAAHHDVQHRTWDRIGDELMTHYLEVLRRPQPHRLAA